MALNSTDLKVKCRINTSWWHFWEQGLEELIAIISICSCYPTNLQKLLIQEGDIYHSLKKENKKPEQSQYPKQTASWGSSVKENWIFLSQPRAGNEEVISLHTASFSTQLEHCVFPQRFPVLCPCLVNYSHLKFQQILFNCLTTKAFSQLRKKKKPPPTTLGQRGQ